MQYREYHSVDKSKWSDGPWQQEPDKVQFVDEATGLPCLIVRGPSGGLCGYVGVKEGHRLFQRDYDEARAIEVHGGLTFASFCNHSPNEGRGVCHIVDPGEDGKVWWLGFDCAHLGDVCPAHERGYEEHGSSYKSLEYVRQEVRSLARQLA